MIASEGNLPLVSIGVPVFNGARFIGTALESLLAQECTDFELIISDNASTDGTASICREFADRDPRIRLILQPRNIGGLPNFAAVLSAARGEYFMWAAADDCWHPQFIALLSEELRSHSTAGLAMAAVRRVNEAGEEIDVIRFDGLKNPNAMEPGVLFKAVVGPAKTKYNLGIYGLYRRALLAKLYPSFTTAAYGDRIFVGLLALCTRFRYVDAILQTRLVRGASLVERYPGERFAQMEERGALGDLQAAWYLGKSVLQCSHVSWRRKLYAFPGMLGFLRMLRGVRQRRQTQRVRSKLPAEGVRELPDQAAL